MKCPRLGTKYVYILILTTVIILHSQGLDFLSYFLCGFISPSRWTVHVVFFFLLLLADGKSLDFLHSYCHIVQTMKRTPPPYGQFYQTNCIFLAQTDCFKNKTFFSTGTVFLAAVSVYVTYLACYYSIMD